MLRSVYGTLRCITHKRNPRNAFVHTVSANSKEMDVAEVKTFKHLANEWWDRDGPFSALHSLNSLRLELTNGVFKGTSSKPWFPLYGTKVLDVGCGGGILSESLSLLGAEVMGIDLLNESIEVAKEHATNVNPSRWMGVPHGAPFYRTVSVREIAQEFPQKFDAVIASEVLEHVTEWEELITDISLCLKPGGHFIATTLNRTYLSYFLGIVAAERILHLVPMGTHSWDKFIEPSRLSVVAVRHDLAPMKILGMFYNPLTKQWSWTNNQAINYAFHAVKNPN